MNKTKHDLSAGIAKLDLNDLIFLSLNSIGLAKTECERELGALQRASFNNEQKNMMYASRNLAEASAKCALACENHHFLIESISRETIKIIK
jgi:hypothetical protein